LDAAGLWNPPVEPSPAEQAVIKAVRRAKLFVFLRVHRCHELFDAEFQGELAEAYADRPKGQPPVPPAQLALATILQAYTGASDDEVIEATIMDRRWQLVLDCMDTDHPPFAKRTLVAFRARLKRNLDRRLVERTVALAARTGGFGGRALRAALDSSPLWGAGRVEDTIIDGTRFAQGPGRAASHLPTLPMSRTSVRVPGRYPQHRPRKFHGSRARHSRPRLQPVMSRSPSWPGLGSK
jgi:hypothetical protein